MIKMTFHFFVIGDVQGICFRAFTSQKAKRSNLTGWVKNLSDGRVEILASGDEKQLDELKKWLWKGPSGAKVKDVICESLPFEDHKGFKIIY